MSIKNINVLWANKSDNGFDIVIGNPPYIDSETMVKIDDKLRKVYSKNYSCAKGNWDIFVLFIQLSLNICNNKGIYSLIIPNKIIASEYATAIRQLVSTYFIYEIRDYSNVEVFENASVYPCTIIGSKTYIRNSNFIVMNNICDIKKKNIIDKELFNSCEYWDVFFNSEGTISIIKKFLSHPNLSDNKNFIIHGAATVKEAYKLKELMIDSEYTDKESFKIINTGTIDRYICYWGIKEMQYIKDKYLYPRVTKDKLNTLSVNRLKQSNSSKIIIAGMSKVIEAIIDFGECVAAKSTTLILSKNEISLKILLAILNSKYTSFCISIIFNSLKMSGGYLNYGVRELSLVAFPSLSKNDSNMLQFIIEQILSVKKDNPNADTSNLENEIDILVYKMFNLTFDEVKVIDPNIENIISKQDYEKKSE